MMLSIDDLPDPLDGITDEKTRQRILSEREKFVSFLQKYGPIIDNIHGEVEMERSEVDYTKGKVNVYKVKANLHELVKICTRFFLVEELFRVCYTAEKYDVAVAICRELINDENDIFPTAVMDTIYYYKFYGLGAALFLNSRFAEALQAWERYVNFREKYWTERIAHNVCDSMPHIMTKPDCIAALVSLRELWGTESLSESEAMKVCPAIYREIIRLYGNWQGALLILNTRYAGKDGLEKVRQRLKKKFRPSYTPEKWIKRLAKCGPLGERQEREFEEIKAQIINYWKAGKFSEAANLAKWAHENDPFDSMLRKDSSEYYYLLSLILAGNLQTYINARRGNVDRVGIKIYCYPPSFNDHYLNMLLLADDQLQSSDIMHRFVLDKVYRQYWDQISEYYAAWFSNYEKAHGKDLLRHTIEKHYFEVYDEKTAYSVILNISPHQNEYEGRPIWLSQDKVLWYRITQGSAVRHFAQKVYKIAKQPEFQAALIELLPDYSVETTEDFVRRILGLPRRGERMLKQKEVFALLQKGFAPLEVIQEASPPFLAGLRYDVFIPELRLAVEYQGEQHFRPVEAFGGEEGFLRTVERDRLKAQLSEINGITIEYIRYDEDIVQRCQEIIQKYKQKRD